MEIREKGRERERGYKSLERERKLLGLMEKDGEPALLTSWIRKEFAGLQHLFRCFFLLLLLSINFKMVC